MAERNSDTYTKQISTGFATPYVANEVSGAVRVAYSLHNTTDDTALSNGDTLNLFKLPKGARIVGLNVTFEAMGASATLVIGDSGDADRYLASTDVSAAGRTDAIRDLGLGYELSSETTIVATIGGANYAADKDLKVVLFYVLN